MPYPVQAEDAARHAVEKSLDAAREAYPAEKARQGDIILRTPLERAIFIAGLAGAVVLVLLVTAMTW